jgi:VPDSG-CTERM motif
MKTNPSHKPFIVSLAVAVVATIVTQSVNAAPNPPSHFIVLEENSSTSLTVTFDGMTMPTGVTVTPTAGMPDSWSVSFDSLLTDATTGTSSTWAEPGSTGAVNRVTVPDIGPFGTLSVLSDISGTAANQDETQSPLVFGVYRGDGGLVFVTFDDDGDAPTTVPDSGSTFGLFGASLFGLFGARRLRCLRLA